jgi:hypothetical protein
MSDLCNPLKIGKKEVDKSQIRGLSLLKGERKLRKKAHDHARGNSICVPQFPSPGRAVTLFFNNLSGADVGTKNADKKNRYLCPYPERSIS